MEALKNVINFLSLPQYSFPLSLVLFFLMLRSKSVWTKRGGMVLLIAGSAFVLVSTLDPDFRAVVTKPDNVPIVMMVFLVGFFVWLSMHKATENDRLLEGGEETFEKTEVEDKIFTWPDLVFSEFICTVLLSAAFIGWAILVEAPIEEPASGTRAPNPAKAPWYFLGLQEMLVYYDPWFAGVLLPTMIVIGLMAIPYIDVNPKGNGYYTFKERKFAISMFLFGFLVLWVSLVILGTFLRGPNWNFFGPFEYWDPHKVEPLVNVNLSEFVWVRWLNTRLPDAILLREAPGFALLIGYFVIMPGLLAKTVFKKLFNQMGFARYSVMVMLLMFMAMLPMKMLLRWTVNMKYLIAIPEYFFNI